MTLPPLPSDRRMLTALLLVMGLACWSAVPTALHMQRHWNVQTRPSWVGLPPGIGDPALPHYDLDTWLIHGGLMRAPRLLDTRQWWVGQWVGQTAFYRPIPSMVFWTEWKVFGDREIRYLPFAILLHLLVVYQFLRATGELARHFRAPSLPTAVLFAGIVFVDGVAILPYQPLVNGAVCALWKNQPDSLCALFLLLGVRRYLRFMRAGGAVPPPPLPPTVPGNRLLKGLRGVALHGAPLGWYLAACASKETGVFLPLLLPLLEWSSLSSPDRHQRRAAIRRLWPLLAALPLFLAYRAQCLHTLTGRTYGSNGAWRERLMADVLGPVSLALAHHDLLPIGVSATVLILLGGVVLRQRRCPRPLTLAELLLWAAAALGMLGLMSLWALGGQDFRAVGLAGVLWMVSEPACRLQVLGVSLTLLALVGALRLSVPLTLFAYGWALLCLGINAFSPPVIHRYYLTDAGFALLVGLGLSLWWVQVSAWITGRRRHSARTEPPREV